MESAESGLAPPASGTAAAHEALLIWSDADGGSPAYALTPVRWRVTIGRAPECVLQLTWDAQVSRIHAVIERVGGVWTVVDDGLSRNGTFVNGEQLRRRRPLDDGDRVVVGNTVITFKLVVVESGTAPTAAAHQPAALVTPAQRLILVALCRPLASAGRAIPATNREIAEEVHLSIDGVKAHLRILSARFGLTDLPQNDKRQRLAQAALDARIVGPSDF